MIYDLIVIGGGMSGISVAHFFRHRKVLIIEKGKLLDGASSKNAGFLISGFGEHYNRTVARWGRERAREIQNIHRSNHSRIRELAVQTGSEYHQTGSFHVALNQKEKSDLLESAGLMQKDGFPVEWQKHAPVGLHQEQDALYNPEDAWIDPVHFWSNLSNGIPCKTNSEVQRTEFSRDTIIVHTTRGTFVCRKLVYCLNAFSSSLLPQLSGRYIPLRGQIVEVPITQNKLFHGPVIHEYGEVYWRFNYEKLIFGGLEYKLPEEETGIVTTVSLKLEEIQLSWIQHNLSGEILKTGPELRSRCSTMAFTVDGFPFVGPLAQPNTFILSGLCGLGHSYSLECASWLYELIEKNENKIPSYFSSERIEGLIPFQGGNWRNLYETWNHGIH